MGKKMKQTNNKRKILNKKERIKKYENYIYKLHINNPIKHNILGDFSLCLKKRRQSMLAKNGKYLFNKYVN
jgi:hypothetical protein